MALLALTFMVTSPFLYCFSRLAILEPLLTALTLAALNIAVRIHRLRRPMLASAAVGLLFTLMLLTKTTAIFFLPGLVWGLVLPLWPNIKYAIRCTLTAAGAFILTFGAWMAWIARNGMLTDFRYYFFVNKYAKPPEIYWPLSSFWWSFHGGLWMDHVLFPLAGVVAVAALLTWLSPWISAAGSGMRGTEWGRNLLMDPVFGASLWIIAGCVFFMTIQNHPQPRYFAVAAVFCFFIVAQGAGELVVPTHLISDPRLPWHPSRQVCWAVLAPITLAMAVNGAWTLNFAAHPEYTFVNAARQLALYMDAHPNGKRLLLSISGDELTLINNVPSICDDFGTQELVPKLADYQPGWFATWNDIDPGTLEDLHGLYSLEQVAAFRALDHPERNMLVLFKLHPLAHGQFRDPSVENLQVPLAGDKIEIPIE